MARILIAEDEDNWQKVLRGILEDYTTELASTIDEAKRLALAPDCELVLLDLFMDQIKFNVHCEMLLDHLASLAPRVAVVVVTGKRLDPGEEFHLGQRGVVEFLFKDNLRPQQLRTTVARVLKRTQSSNTSPIVPRDGIKKLESDQNRRIKLILETLTKNPEGLSVPGIVEAANNFDLTEDIVKDVLPKIDCIEKRGKTKGQKIFLKKPQSP